MSGSARMSTGH